MTAHTLTFNEELEWRSASVTAQAGQISSLSVAARMSIHILASVYHVRILWSLHRLGRSTRDMLKVLYAPKSLTFLEKTDDATRKELAELLARGSSGLEAMIARLRTMDLGVFAHYYSNIFNRLDSFNRDVKAFIEALAPTDSPVILLSPKDQNHLLRALFSSEEASEDFHKVFAQK